MFNLDNAAFNQFLFSANFKMSVFQRFATVATFNTTAWQQFINETKLYEQNQIQNEIINHHTDANQHVNYDGHTNKAFHSDIGIPHYNHPMHTQTSHTDTIAHTNNPSLWPHNNNHNNYPYFQLPHYNFTPCINFYTPHGNHSNSHNNFPADPHTNHQQFHTNFPCIDTNLHQNSPGYHNNTPGCINMPEHTDTPNIHNNTGFEHDNFVPSKPAFFDMSNGKQVSGTITIGIYSYDKNTDGFGTQDNQSKTVRYDLLIRRVKKINGAADVSPWKTLLNDSAENSDGGITFDLNTIDPLGTGNLIPANTEGYYEIKAIARNSPIKDVVFQSQEQVFEIKIKQNNKPDISVTNKNEIINFMFSKFGRLSPDGNTFNNYDTQLYSDQYSSNWDMNKGIFVVIEMKDADMNNWQKGNAYLKDKSGNIVAISNIMWSNSPTSKGSNSVASNNAVKRGYAFFSKNNLPSDTVIKNAIIRVEVQDYLDEACTITTGDITAVEKVSSTDNTILYLDIDTKKPTGSISINGVNGITDTRTVKLNISAVDSGGSGKVTKMMISNDPTFTGAVWQNYKTTVNNWTLTSGGGVKTVYIKFMDGVGNESNQFSSNITYKVIPTLNTPIASGAAYLGEDMSLTATGTKIEVAKYRIYYTTLPEAPPISDGSDNPGEGWIPSKAEDMVVTNNANLSANILASDLGNINWTYVIFKVWAASDSGNGVIKYSLPIILSNNGTEIFNYVGHNQIIKINDNDIVLSSPNEPVETYGPYNSNDISKLDYFNFLENNASVKYRLEFDIVNPNIVKGINDIGVIFDFNLLNERNIELNMEKMKLQKMQYDGSFLTIKTFGSPDSSMPNKFIKEGINRFIVNIGNDQDTNKPIVDVYGEGRYVIEYSGKILVNPSDSEEMITIRTSAQMEIYTGKYIYPDLLDDKRPSRKFTIDSKITKLSVKLG